MTGPVIGFAGMTHLGLVSAVAAAEKGFQVVCFDPDEGLTERIRGGDLPVVEPGLQETLKRNSARIEFTGDAEALKDCGVVYAAPDVATSDDGASDLHGLETILNAVDPSLGGGAVLVILSQVPPGFTRSRAKADRSLFCQVETLIFGDAVDRALNPERFIVGCADQAKALPGPYREFLAAFGCPVLPMRYESAELAKIAINCFLVAQVSTTNTLAELCEAIGADWREIAPALKLDKRIGPDAYLKPGLGIAGGNLERDLATVMRLAAAEDIDAGMVKSWIANSAYRKDWAYRMLQATVLNNTPDAAIAVWGLAYKENTASTRNSPALALLGMLSGDNVTVYDPVVSSESAGISFNAADDPLVAAKGVDVLVIMTQWPEFGEVAVSSIAEVMNGRTIIDPYGVLDSNAIGEAGLDHYTLGVSVARGRA